MRERRILTDLLESYRGEVVRVSQSGDARDFDLPGVFDSAPRPVSFVALGLVTLIVSITVNPVAGVGAPLIAWGIRRGSRAAKRRHVTTLLERDLPALLASIASSARAGIDPLKALGEAAVQFSEQSPLRRELAVFRAGLARGGAEMELIGAFCAAYEHPDIELFKHCLALSRTHGSSLTEPLHRVVRVVRQRQSFRRKTRAALAMHRMSAIGIAGCAALVAFMQMMVNRKGIQIALEKPVGVLFLVGGASLVGLGVVWMLSMGREEKL